MLSASQTNNSKGNGMGVWKWVGAAAAIAGAPLTGGASLLGLAAVAAGGAVAGAVAETVYDHTPIGSLQKSFVDNVLRDKVLPIEGSIVHCSLFGVEHTGVYVGNGKIVELLGTGVIRKSGPGGFINGTNSVSIYVACDGENPIGSSTVANRARSMVGSSRDYNLVLDNCHQFSCGCISGNFENANNYFWLVESEIAQVLNGGKDITWRVWEMTPDDWVV